MPFGDFCAFLWLVTLPNAARLLMTDLLLSKSHGLGMPGMQERGSPLSPILQPANPNHPRRRIAMVMKILAEGFGVFVLTLILMVIFSLFLHA